MSTLTEFTTEEEYNAHFASLPPPTLLVLSFYAPWAAPCAQMNTVLQTLAQSYPIKTPLATSWVSINAEELPEISESFDVTAVPYLVLIRNKEVVDTVSGSDAAKVRNAIEKHATAPQGVDSLLGSGNREPLTKREVKPALASKDFAKYEATENDTKTGPEYSAGQSAQGVESAATSKEELHKRLSELVKAASVMLFMKGTPSAPQCGFSRQLVALLRENGVRYGFFNILADDEVRQGLKEFADWPTFPQLWVGGELVGGLDIVRSHNLSLYPAKKMLTHDF
jgi:Grx4 family monothiol glutaredoxin